MRSRLALVPALAVAAVVALAGCSGGSDEPAPAATDDAAETDTGAGGGSVGDCLIGTWQLDGQANAQQLQENFAANGAAITATAVEGQVTLTVDASTMTYDSDITYTMTGDMSGLELVIAQNQAGVSTGSWSEVDGSVSFSDWETGIVVTNTVTIGGTVTELPMDLPEDTGTGVDMAVTCSGDSLETTPDQSPFTGYWSRIG